MKQKNLYEEPEIKVLDCVMLSAPVCSPPDTTQVTSGPTDLEEFEYEEW